MPEPIAVVGVGLRFPGARTLDEFWALVNQRMTVFREVPPQRWPIAPECVYDPIGPAIDKVYVTRGAFLQSTDFGDAAGSWARDEPRDPLFHLAATLGMEAWKDGLSAGLDPKRVGVVLGNLFLPTETSSGFGRSRLAGHDAAPPLGRDRWSAHGPAQYLADKLGLGGGALCVDAACASSLFALALAMQRLRRGEVDAMLAGGISRPDCLYTQMGFCQLRALSPSGQPRPFDALADGMLVGEGGAVFLLKRVGDALRDGDFVYALLPGVGLSNDRQGSLLAPSSDGQLRAMLGAYSQAAWKPDDIDYIECHATGTPVGDRTEIQSLLQLFEGSSRLRPVVLGSVKANLGHTLTAAGAAGLVKVLLALRHQTLPPQPAFDRWLLDDPCMLQRFAILKESLPWPAAADQSPRRAAVSAFGFGGINAHLLVEEWQPQTARCYSLASHGKPVEGITTVLREFHALHEEDRPENAEVAGLGIPPIEIAQMSQQQKAMLALAKELQGRAGLTREQWAKTGVVIGLEQDEEALYYSYRWTAPLAGLPATGPELTPDRTLGSLGSIVASRVARFLGCGGPAFTLSAGPKALERLTETIDSLFSTEIDRLLAGWLPFGDQSAELCNEWTKAFPQAQPLMPGVLGFLALFERMNVQDEPKQKPDFVLSYARCLEFARGSAARALGERFACLDSLPMRVRLPDEPLMLVDRVTRLEGEPLSMKPGRIVTEHEVREESWYLDGGRMPASLSIEAGQADLLLVGYLGIDLVTQGQAVYRLLDAEVTFHRGLPEPGEKVVYDIHISRFQRYAATYLFFFEFDGVINGSPFITMRHGCAGFFRDEDLRGGEGLVLYGAHDADRESPRSWLQPRVPIASGTLSAQALAALREGKLDDAFGDDFNAKALGNGLRLPSGRLALITEVDHLDPVGGKHQRGVIRSSLRIQPDAWHLVCHFKDDPVMPGTLMYECCLQTLRLWMLRAGFISDDPGAIAEPIVGRPSRLKCRGQVVLTTQLAQFEIHLKETGYNPHVYALADAFLYADGKPIVQIEDLTLQFTNVTKEKIDAYWTQATRPTDSEAGIRDFSKRRLLEFALGRPSRAFGPVYAVYDSGRFIARLPSPPFLFLDRIAGVEASYMSLGEGNRILAEYHVPPNAWYFDAAGSDVLPFAVLLECALQPCGWLAAFQGCALRSEEDLAFRNLGGTAQVHRLITRHTGELRTEVRVTKVVQTRNMILLHYAFAIRSAHGAHYTGSTYFGFFTRDMLRQQQGISGAAQLSETERTPVLPLWAVLPSVNCDWAMIHDVRGFELEGGPSDRGRIAATADVDPCRWFFAAHFHQDPVWPGSLGLEGFMQTVRALAALCWPSTRATPYPLPEPGSTHEWTYRGQVLPTHGRVTIVAELRQRDDAERRLSADGLLYVDGLPIYHMKGFQLHFA